MSRIVLEPLEKSTLSDWFATEVGRYVLAWEQAQFDNAVEDVFGFNAAQLGLPAADFLRANRMPHRLSIGPESGCSIRADVTQLPLASQSVDLMVLPHVLEFCADPHQVLREVERVLMPEGQVVLSGFNPLSLWGISRKFGGHRSEYPWRGNFLALTRLRDWLKLLGFELNGGKFGCYAPPLVQAKWVDRFRFMEYAGDRWWPIAGGIYVVRAVKRNVGMRLVTPAWRGRRTQVRSLAAVARRERWGESAQRSAVPALKLIAGGALPSPPTPQPALAVIRGARREPGRDDPSGDKA